MRRAHLAVLLVFAGIVGWGVLAVVLGAMHWPGPWSYVWNVPAIVGLGWYLKVRCDECAAIVKRVKAANWLACTACAYPLTHESTRCPECGVEVDPDAAVAMWKESQWGPS